jgi:hypothetical protein
MHPDNNPNTTSGKRNWELVGVAKADGWQGPFTPNSPKPVTKENWDCVAGQDEDPFLWRSPRGYHIITHGMCPSGYLQAHYKYSTDGIHWHTSPRQTYKYSMHFTDGTEHTFWRVERPQLAFGKTYPDGSVSDPIVLYNGVCDDGPDICLGAQTGKVYTIARELKRPVATSPSTAQ